jgi:hypothetical protein
MQTTQRIEGEACESLPYVCVSEAQLKLATTWNDGEHVWRYFTTKTEANRARRYGEIVNLGQALFRCRVRKVCPSCKKDPREHTPDCERAPATREGVLDL